MKYTIDTLREINARFCGSHILINYDVDKANMYVELIENTRSEKIPSVGDCVRYTNEYGDYYGAAHIEKADVNEVYICERPYTPLFMNMRVESVVTQVVEHGHIYQQEN